MASRPIFVPHTTGNAPGVNVYDIEFEWFPGMAASQKQKSIASLHAAAAQQGFHPLLEISSKSFDSLGIELSAFNLPITTQRQGRVFTVEVAFQSSKVFERGGPYLDLLDGTSRDAKKDMRLRDSGNLVAFKFFGREFPLVPRTFFYDWLYVNAVHQNVRLAERLAGYSGFTDIEFNPKKSINCQAYAAAVYVSLIATGSLQRAIESPESFQEVMASEYQAAEGRVAVQSVLI